MAEAGCWLNFCFKARTRRGKQSGPQSVPDGHCGSVGYMWLDTKSNGKCMAVARRTNSSTYCSCAVAGPPTIRFEATDLTASTLALYSDMYWCTLSMPHNSFHTSNVHLDTSTSPNVSTACWASALTRSCQSSNDVGGTVMPRYCIAVLLQGACPGLTTCPFVGAVHVQFAKMAGMKDNSTMGVTLWAT